MEVAARTRSIATGAPVEESRVSSSCSMPTRVVRRLPGPGKRCATASAASSLRVERDMVASLPLRPVVPDDGFTLGHTSSERRSLRSLLQGETEEIAGNSVPATREPVDLEVAGRPGP